MVEFNKILVLQTAFLGDVILTTPLVRALKQTFPQAEIDIMLIPQTRQVFAYNPNIRNILEFDKRRNSQKVVSFLSNLRTIHHTNYDVAVSAQLSLTTSLFMYMGGIRKRIGFPRQKLITDTTELSKGIPIAKRYLKLMKVFVNDDFPSQTELFWNDSIQANADSLFHQYILEGEKVIGMAPGSIWNTKRWLPEYFVEVIRKLYKKGIKTILLGGNEDAELCQQIADKADSNAINLAGKLSILGSAAFIKKLPLLLTNDSAPLHLANAVQTDVIALFGPTITSFGFAPFRENDIVLETNLECRPCGKHGHHKCPLKHFDCMKMIFPDTVFDTIIQALENK